MKISYIRLNAFKGRPKYRGMHKECLAEEVVDQLSLFELSSLAFPAQLRQIPQVLEIFAQMLQLLMNGQ